jgi:hypothetical protein
MADTDIIQSAISQLGQSQGERASKELQAGFVVVDERGPEEVLAFTQEFADQVRHWKLDGTALQAASGWRRFFERSGATPEARLASTDGATPAQLALFLAFLRLYDLPRTTLNRLTDLHLQFYYERVLGFTARPAAPDHAHVIFELKKNTNPVRLATTHELSAKKDATGVERVYVPVRESVINAAKVDRLRTLFVDKAGRGTIRVAPVANSADGAGAPLEPAESGFAPFGHEQLPTGTVGFAVASPVLRMAEGTRKVQIHLHTSLSHSETTEALGSALQVFVTGEKGWLGPYGVAVQRTGTSPWLTITFTIPPDATAVVDYDTKLHEQAFASASPVAQIHLKADSPGVGYDDVRRLTINKARVSVSVSGVRNLLVENDAGRLDPKKPFPPFGTQPITGSRFLVGTEEAFAKALTALKLHIEWLGVPSDWKTHYTDYSNADILASRFTAAVTYTDAAAAPISKNGVRLFEDTGPNVTLSLDPSTPALPVLRKSSTTKYRALKDGGSKAALELARAMRRTNTVLSEPPPVVAPTPHFLTLTLSNDFLHATYRKVTLENAIGQKHRNDGTPIILNEPYTPMIRKIEMDYDARTPEVNVGSTDLDDYVESDVQFFHVDAFGQRREHGWLRHQMKHVRSDVPLFPPHPDEGELLVGVTGVGPGDSVCLLLQVAEGSADPDLEPPEITWSVLCDNHWRALTGDELVLDTTNRLLRSGLLGVLIPRDATTENTLLERARIWLRAAVRRDSSATSRLLAVLANAAEVQFRDHGNDPRHLEVALAAGSINKLKAPIAAVKSVQQPYASFGGRMVEAKPAMATRASERLRHKHRCITPWDYERVVLEAFPRVHRVKCLPHARGDGHWLSPGYVLLIVVPDLRNDNARDPLRPRTDAGTLDAIKKHVEARAGMHLKDRISVRNPTYQKVRLHFNVKFHRGFEANEYRNVLRVELTAFLSPWAFDAKVPISFGGVLYKSVLINFVEERHYVDYVTDFELRSYTDTEPHGDPLDEVRARRPDAILVSDTAHDIEVL